MDVWNVVSIVIVSLFHENYLIISVTVMKLATQYVLTLSFLHKSTVQHVTQGPYRDCILFCGQHSAQFIITDRPLLTSFHDNFIVRWTCLTSLRLCNNLCHHHLINYQARIYVVRLTIVNWLIFRHLWMKSWSLEGTKSLIFNSIGLDYV